MKTTKALIGTVLVVISVVAVMYFYFNIETRSLPEHELRKVQWRVTGPLSTETTVLSIRWGRGKGKVELVKPECADCTVGGGFNRFIVFGKSIYVLDSLQAKIMEFNEGRLFSTYRTFADRAFTVTTKYIFGIDGLGTLYQYDKKTGAELRSRPILRSEETSNWLSLFVLKDSLVLYKFEPKLERNSDSRFICLSVNYLKEKKCPQLVDYAERLEIFSSVYVFPDGSFASLGQDNAWLYDRKGEIIAGFPSLNIKIDLGFGYQQNEPLIYPTVDGIYYVDLSIEKAKIVFRKWQKLERKT